MLEGGDIASYSGKDIKALVEQSKEQIKENGEKALKSREMPDDAHLEIMELNPPTARGMMEIYEMGNLEDADTNIKWDTEQTVIPDEASDMATQIQENNGTPPKGYKGGRTYNNTPKDDGAQKLPDGINYKEYDIHPYVKGQNRGVERIVIGDDGSVWYTNDHYQTFTRIK